MKTIAHSIILIATTLISLACLGEVVESSTKVDVQTGMKLLEKPDSGSLSQAISIFQKALSTNSNQKEAHMGLVYARLIEYAHSPRKDSKGLQDALVHVDWVLKQNPKQEEAYINKSQILFFLGRHNEGLSTLKSAREKLPYATDLPVAQVVYFVQLGKTEEAIQFSRQTATRGKEGAELQIRFGIVWLQAGQVQLAKEHLARSIQIQESPWAWKEIGLCYMAEQNWEMAAKCFNQTLSMDKGFYPVYNLLTYCYIKQGKYSEAIESSTSYLKAFPQDLPALENLAVVYEKTGDKRQARLAWTKLRIQTKDPAQKQRASEHINTFGKTIQ